MKRTEPDTAPVALPLVLLVVHEDGTLTATLDGAPLVPPEWAPPWRRDSFPQIIDQASHDRTRPIRVEVREADGAVFTDLLPARPRRAALEPPLEPTPPTPGLPRFYEVEGDGFVPGEDVAVAIVASHTNAAHSGFVRALIDPKPFELMGGIEVVLFGRISGTTAIRRLP